MSGHRIKIRVDGEAVEYQGRSVAEAFGRVRLADLRALASDAKPNTLRAPGWSIAMGREGSDGYGWVALRDYELLALLAAAEVLDDQIEAAREGPSA